MLSGCGRFIDQEGDDMSGSPRSIFGALSLALLFLIAVPIAASAPKPVYIGLDAEFGYANSTSAEAIRQGILIAIDEINRAGGVLNSRPLALEERANHSVPARSIENIISFARNPDLVAVFCGRFSPTVLEALPTIHQIGIPLMDPWAAADAVIDNGYKTNFAFRLSLRDSWAMNVMLRHAEQKGASRVGMLLLNTSWGRSNLKAAENFAAEDRRLKIVATHWFNWNDTTFLEKYQSLRKAGAEAIILVANANEAVILLKEVAGLPAAERIPIISHWGVTGGTLFEMTKQALRKLDFSVVQTYSFIGDQSEKAQTVITAAQRLFKVKGARNIQSPVGVAHAYDLTHILALAINQAGSTDRMAIRAALETVGPYAGLIKTYSRPFTADRHDALSPDEVFMATYAEDGAIVRAPASVHR